MKENSSGIKTRSHEKKIDSSAGGVLSMLFQDAEQAVDMDNVDSREVAINRWMTENKWIGATAEMDSNKVSTIKGNLRKDFLRRSLTIKTFAKLMAIIGVKDLELGVEIIKPEGTTVRVESKLDCLSKEAPKVLNVLVEKISASEGKKPYKANGNSMSIKSFIRWMGVNGINIFDVYIRIQDKNNPHKTKELGVAVYI